MSERISRRDLLKATIAAALMPSAAEGSEPIQDAINQTITSLAQGISSLHGKRVNPRDSGFAYHPNLLDHYARGLKLQHDLTPKRISAEVVSNLRNRIQIFSVARAEEALVRAECKEALMRMMRTMPVGDVSAIVYISSDRTFQRIYSLRKRDDESLEFLESYPVSTSAEEPKVPLLRDVHQSVKLDKPFTPLGLFVIPFDGVRPALLGEVTKIERPDITRHYFESIDIDGKPLPFVRNFGQTSSNEIITVSGDTHLLWSPEINGRGIKMHDTTEMESLGKPASSGCLRTPSVRRFTLLTAANKKPTQIFIYWERTKNISDRDLEGFGGSFGGKKIKE